MDTPRKSKKEAQSQFKETGSPLGGQKNVEQDPNGTQKNKKGRPRIPINFRESRQ